MTWPGGPDDFGGSDEGSHYMSQHNARMGCATLDHPCQSPLPSQMGRLDADAIIAYDLERAQPAPTHVHDAIRAIADKPHYTPQIIAALLQVASPQIVERAPTADPLAPDTRTTAQIAVWYGSIDAARRRAKNRRIRRP